MMMMITTLTGQHVCHVDMLRMSAFLLTGTRRHSRRHGGRALVVTVTDFIYVWSHAACMGVCVEGELMNRNQIGMSGRGVSMAILNLLTEGGESRKRRFQIGEYSLD
jgi:hypothetical protein